MCACSLPEDLAAVFRSSPNSAAAAEAPAAAAAAEDPAAAAAAAAAAPAAAAATTAHDAGYDSLKTCVVFINQIYNLLKEKKLRWEDIEIRYI